MYIIGVLSKPGEPGRRVVCPVPANMSLCQQHVICHVISPDRLARKFAYQALLIEEFARAGVRIEFVNGPRGDSPEDQLLVQFQGMFAEYEKAQLMDGTGAARPTGPGPAA